MVGAIKFAQQHHETFAIRLFRKLKLSSQEGHKGDFSSSPVVKEWVLLGFVEEKSLSIL